MDRFSNDGQWWWDGTTWLAASQVVLPDLPKTEFEQSARMVETRARATTFGRLSWVNSATLSPIKAITGVPMLMMLPRLVGDQRSWRLEQLAAATAYLLGSDEPMVAAEVATLAVFPEDYPVGGTAVAVTAKHVLVFRIDPRGEGQPRWIALARPAADVKLEFQKRLMGLAPGLVVTAENGRWTIRGTPGLFKPQPVLEAWRQALRDAVRA